MSRSAVVAVSGYQHKLPNIMCVNVQCSMVLQYGIVSHNVFCMVKSSTEDNCLHLHQTKTPQRVLFSTLWKVHYNAENVALLSLSQCS